MDFKQFAEKLGLEEDEYLELLELFIDTSATDIANLENAVGTKNAVEAEKAAHSLKGASASLGLTKIAELAKQIEKSAREGSTKDGVELLESIKEKIIGIKKLMGE
jgi:HPt (histidine-containing phosphotransfer) domain-containing protein